MHCLFRTSGLNRFLLIFIWLFATRRYSLDQVKKMLIVDDEMPNREMLEAVFENDFQLMLVESGESALEVIPEFMPDIILLDVMMAGINGYEVCKRIRDNHDYASMVVVIISARALESDRQKGFDVGANDYITKPFSLVEIKQKIAEMLES